MILRAIYATVSNDAAPGAYRVSMLRCVPVLVILEIYDDGGVRTEVLNAPGNEKHEYS